MTHIISAETLTKKRFHVEHELDDPYCLGWFHSF